MAASARLIAVTLVVLSGITNAGFRSGGSLAKLLDSDYGDLLLKKIAIVAAMLALAYLNRFVLVPRLRAAGRRGTECTRALERISKVRRQF